MAYSVIPLANAPVKSSFYTDAQYTEHDFAQATIGVPHVAASGITTGNGAYPILCSPGCQVYTVAGVITTVGTGSTSNISLTLGRANNGVNVSNSVTTFNVVTTGTNVAGNVFSFGPLTYNLYANGTNSGTNVCATGGLTFNVGDYLVATHTGNTLVAACFVEYSLTAMANVSA